MTFSHARAASLLFLLTLVVHLLRGRGVPGSWKVADRLLQHSGVEYRGDGSTGTLPSWARSGGGRAYRFAVDTFGDEGGQRLVLPPSNRPQVDRRQGAVQEHGLLAAHLADHVGGQEVLTLEVFRHGPSSAAGVGGPAALRDVFGSGDLRDVLERGEVVGSVEDHLRAVTAEDRIGERSVPVVDLGA